MRHLDTQSAFCGTWIRHLQAEKQAVLRRETDELCQQVLALERQQKQREQQEQLHQRGRGQWQWGGRGEREEVAERQPPTAASINALI